MNYSGLIKNDLTGNGIGVSLFVSGCPLHCPGCHNPEAQDYNFGKEFTQSTIDEILTALVANGVTRNLYIMGGEPLDVLNLPEVVRLIDIVRSLLPNTKIYVWTGFTYGFLIKTALYQPILSKIDYLIDGPYIQEQRDLSLKMRGSRNQRVIDMRKTRKSSKVILMEGT